MLPNWKNVPQSLGKYRNEKIRKIKWKHFPNFESF